MAQVRWPNLAQTTLTGAGIGVGGASFTVASAGSFGASDFYIRVEDAVSGAPGGTTLEFMRVTNVAGSTFTVTKGLAGTGDQAHPAGSFVTAVLIDLSLINGLVQQLIGSAEVAVSPAGGQGTVTLSVPDQSILFRRLKLENGVTRVRSHQTGLGAPVLTTAGTWYNLGATATITPAVASYIMVWGYASGVGNVSSTVYGRVTFGGATGEGGGTGFPVRDDATGFKTISFFDTYVAGAGALAIQAQLTADNNADTWAPRGSPGSNLELLILAIPST